MKGYLAYELGKPTQTFWSFVKRGISRMKNKYSIAFIAGLNNEYNHYT